MPHTAGAARPCCARGRPQDLFVWRGPELGRGRAASDAAGAARRKKFVVGNRRSGAPCGRVDTVRMWAAIAARPGRGRWAVDGPDLGCRGCKIKTVMVMRGRDEVYVIILKRGAASGPGQITDAALTSEGVDTVASATRQKQ